MIFRLWSNLTSEGLPTRNATCDWWLLCDCGHVDHLPVDTRGPRGLLADTDEGIPTEVQEAAANIERHRCRAPKRPAYTPTPPRSHRTIRWTGEMDEVIRESSVADAVQELGVSPSAVHRRRAKLGVASHQVTRWTRRMDDVVITRSVAAAAAELGLNRGRIEWRRKHLRERGLMAAERITRAWTPEEDALVLTLSTAQAAAATGRAEPTIRTRKSRLMAARRAAA